MRRSVPKLRPLPPFFISLPLHRRLPSFLPDDLIASLAVPLDLEQQEIFTRRGFVAAPDRLLLFTRNGSAAAAAAAAAIVACRLPLSRPRSYLTPRPRAIVWLRRCLLPPQAVLHHSRGSWELRRHLAVARGDWATSAANNRLCFSSVCGS